jgi:hypothetical protein
MSDAKKAIATLRYFVQKATKWNEGADELARAEGVYGALDHIDTLTRERDEVVQDAARWRFYCCPQTALILGSNCDPNDDSIDWRAEINRLADERIAALTQEDA